MGIETKVEIICDRCGEENMYIHDGSTPHNIAHQKGYEEFYTVLRGHLVDDVFLCKNCSKEWLEFKKNLIKAVKEYEDLWMKAKVSEKEFLNILKFREEFKITKEVK